jgi:hypothetical protein
MIKLTKGLPSRPRQRATRIAVAIIAPLAAGVMMGSAPGSAKAASTVAFGVTAQASVVQPGGGHGGAIQPGVTASRPGAGMAPQTAYPSGCSYNAPCTYDSGWTLYGNGSCLARVIATWSGASTNVLQAEVDVQSPYWFGACTAHATVVFGSNSGPISVGPFYGFSCAASDPSCAHPGVKSYTVVPGVPQARARSVNSVNAYLTK